MTLEELIAKRKQIEIPHVSDEDILRMTHGSNNARVRKMRHTLANEVLLAFAFIQLIELVAHLVGAPPWLRYIYYVATAAYVATDFLGYRWQTNLGASKSVPAGLRQYLQRMKTLELLSRLATAIIGIVAVVVIGLRFTSPEGRIVAWILMSPLVPAVMWLSSRRWTRKARETKSLLEKFKPE